MTAPAKERVLAICLGGVEAFVEALPALARLRTDRPDVHLCALVRPSLATLARADPDLDQVIAWDPPATLRGWLALAAEVRAQKIARICDLSPAGAARGLRRALGPFGPAWSIAPPAPDTALPDVSWILRRRPAGVRSDPPTIIFCPGHDAGDDADAWPAAAYGELAALLRREGFAVTVVGDAGDARTAQAILKRAPVRDLTGRPDYAEAAAAAARALAVVGGSGRLMSLMAAAGPPVLALRPRGSSAAAPRGHVTILEAAPLSELSASAVRRALERMLPPRKKSI